MNEFEGKAPAAYASEAAVVREALEAEEDKDEGTTSSERSLLGGLSREEGRCLAIMLLHSELRHADTAARKQYYLKAPEEAEGKVVSEASVVVEVDGNAQAEEKDAADSTESATVAAADKLIAVIDAEAIVSGARSFSVLLRYWNPQSPRQQLFYITQAAEKSYGTRLGAREMRARRSILCDALHRKLTLITAMGRHRCVLEGCNSGATLATQSTPGNCTPGTAEGQRARLGLARDGRGSTTRASIWPPKLGCARNRQHVRGERVGASRRE